jgi:hypothetical protein
VGDHLRILLGAVVTIRFCPSGVEGSLGLDDISWTAIRSLLRYRNLVLWAMTQAIHFRLQQVGQSTHDPLQQLSLFLGPFLHNPNSYLLHPQLVD